MKCTPLGDAGILLQVGDVDDAATSGRVRGLVAALQRERLPAVTDLVPAFATVAVFYDPRRVEVGGSDGGAQGRVAAWILDCAERAGAIPDRDAAVVELPVCYGGEDGPDLADVAARAGLSAEEVVRLHTGTTYEVAALGFAPGFPYLRGLPPALHTPRRATPRTRVPAGSVGIGGAQTGIYPLATPGGWNLIGRTPARLFQPENAPPTLLHAGDRVRFRAIPAEALAALERAAQARLPAGGAESGATGPEGDAAVEAGAPPGTMPLVEIVRAGVFTTVQDLGRVGYQHTGVSAGGAVDAFAARVANALVGNADHAAVLEGTWVGPEVKFLREAWIAVTGAEVDAVPGWRPVHVRAGETLTLGALGRGARVYLAVAGGFAVPPVLGSASTYLAAAVGGHRGRALRAGDVLAAGPAARVGPRAEAAGWQVGFNVRPPWANPAVVRIMPGPQWDWFGDEARRRLLTEAFRVSPQSDRMGLRLAGPTLERVRAGEMASEAVAWGSIQVPPDGRPIVLLADRQTLGGYPKIGTVASVDLPLLAQLRPEQELRFTEITLREAERLYTACERVLAKLRVAIGFHFT